MAQLFPGPLSAYDLADRADGPADAGAGSTIWSNQLLGGFSSTLVVTGGQLATTATDGGALSAGNLTNFLHVYRFSAITGGALGVFFRLQSATTSSWEGYWIVIEGQNWAINKRKTGTTTTLTSASVPSSMSQGIALRVYNSLFEVYRLENNVFEQTPVLSATDTDFTTGRYYLNLPRTDWLLDRIEQADPALAAPAGGAVTIYVDPDHASSSDAYYRDQASSPSTPVKTITAAASLVYATPTWADTIHVAQAVSADATNADPRMYKPLNNGINRFGDLAATFPFADNSGNQPIVVQGDTTGGNKPIINSVSGRFLKSWTFQDLQFGYDVGSGLDFDMNGALSVCADLTFRRILYTSGGADLHSFAGDFLWEDCTIHGKLPALPGSQSGRGFGLSPDADYAGGPTSAGHVAFTGCLFDGIRGNDGIQASLGAYNDLTHSLTVTGCIFHNVTEGLSSYHTDAIQVFGISTLIVRNNVFIGCSDAVIVSDLRNGTIVFEDNLCNGIAGQITAQGFEHLIVRQNTILNQNFLDSSIILYTRATPSTNRVTIQNNIYGGIFYRDDTSRAHASGSVIDKNVSFTAAGASTGYGNNLAGTSEFGTSSRISGLPTSFAPHDLDSSLPTSVPPNYELANSPNLSPGIGGGTTLTTVTDTFSRSWAPPTADLYGRAWSSPPDCGALQSSGSVTVAAVARPPRVISFSPTGSGISPTSNVVIVLYPKPGEEIDPATVTNASVRVTDPGGVTLPVTALTLSSLNSGGFQTITLDIDGEMYPYVSYTATMFAGVADTEGSATVLNSAWTFTIVGPAPAPAVYHGDAPVSSSASGWTVGVV